MKKFVLNFSLSAFFYCFSLNPAIADTELLGYILGGLGKAMQENAQYEMERKEIVEREQRVLQAYNAPSTTSHPGWGPLLAIHPDAFEIINSQAFKDWKYSKGLDFAAGVDSSRTPRYVASVISDYKAQTNYVSYVSNQPPARNLNEIRQEFDRIHQDVADRHHRRKMEEMLEERNRIDKERLLTEQRIQQNLQNIEYQMY